MKFKYDLVLIFQILRAQPTVSDIDVLAELLQFEKIKCDDPVKEDNNIKKIW